MKKKEKTDKPVEVCTKKDDCLCKHCVRLRDYWENPR